MELTLTHVASFSVPKRGNTPDENEDAYLAPLLGAVNKDYSIKFAVADGATESAFSKEWADLLVTYYKDNPFKNDCIQSVLSKATSSWQERIGSIELPWYAQEKLRYGAFSSFLGVEFNLAEACFNAVAIGDSNLFRVRDDQCYAFPIRNSIAFNSTPLLVSTKSFADESFVSNFKFESGDIITGDTFILATDALSAWILAESEKNNSPWNSIVNLTPPSPCGYSVEDFIFWIRNLRDGKMMKNDDTTLIVIKF